MESFELSIPLFHVGKADQNKNFVAGNKIPESKAKSNWAGKGVYFWDNLGNANYWLKTNDSSDKLSIVKACLKMNDDCLLDLTDTDVVSEFKKWFLILRMEHIIDKNDSYTYIGDIVNVIINVIIRIQQKEFDDDPLLQCFKDMKIYAIKIIGYYPKTIDRFLFNDDEEDLNTNKKRPTLKSKVVYNIKNQNLLKQRTIVKNEEK